MSETITKRTSMDVWLEDHNAIHLNRAHFTTDRKLRASGACIDLWQVNGKVIIIQTHADDHGWDVYIPASNALDAMVTLAAVAKYCEVA